MRRDFDTWQSVTIGADFPAGEPTKLVEETQMAQSRSEKLHA
jgi:hypothetical protein